MSLCSSPSLSMLSRMESSDAVLEESMASGSETINVQIFIPDRNTQHCLQLHVDTPIWEVKQRVLKMITPDLPEGFNYGLFLPPCNGRAGKFLCEERPFRDYPFQDCVPYLELKFKKRVYKMLKIDEKMLRHLHTKSNLKKFLDQVIHKQNEKVEKSCAEGLDPNFHDAHGETPLTIAAGMVDNRQQIMTLVSGGAHLDFRNQEGQTPLHRAAFLNSHTNVQILLELGASPNARDRLGLTPLYYSLLKSDTSPNITELMLRDFAEFGVRDPHGNQEVHQACKNGLVAHLEHLLFYGAEMNCKNINGNTPLHVCSVNNQEGCARVLLFRGADKHVSNNQGQTAQMVAVVTGHQTIAELVRTHDVAQVVPYKGFPRFNSSRRLTWTSKQLSRCRTSSQSDFSTLQRRARSAAPSPAPSVMSTIDATQTLPSGTDFRDQMVHNLRRKISTPQGVQSSNSTMAQMNGHYRVPPPSSSNMMGKNGMSASNGALNKRHSANLEHSQSMKGGNNGRPKSIVAAAGGDKPKDVNIPRILVIPRGPKGFGFILRGAKKLEAGVVFEPSAEIPALQYFEGVDLHGMAMKGGLKPGDFLLEINDEDVRCASHDHVVTLIQKAGDTITLKVITIDLSQPAVPYFATLPNRRKTAPEPPRRHPSTSLTFAKGQAYARNIALLESNFRDPNENGVQMRQIAEQVENGERAPSIRARSTSRRTSMAEIEQFMANQNGQDGSSPNDSIHSYEFGANGTLQRNSSKESFKQPKVYNSVAEMKRQRSRLGSQTMSNGSQKGALPVSVPVIAPEAISPMKSFASSPNLNQQLLMQQEAREAVYASREEHQVNASSHLSIAREMSRSQSGLQYMQYNQSYGYLGDSSRNRVPSEDVFDSAGFESAAGLSGEMSRRSSIDSNGSSLYGPGFRSTNRPKTPPPPPPKQMPSSHYSMQSIQRNEPQNYYQNTQTASSNHSSNSRSSAAPPPAPPPPPPIGTPPRTSSQGPWTSTPIREQNETTPTNLTPPTTMTPSDCRGITAEALMSVKLKSNKRVSIIDDRMGGRACGPPKGVNPANVELKSVLAARRSMIISDSSTPVTSSNNSSFDDSPVISRIVDTPPPRQPKPAMMNFDGDLKAAIQKRKQQVDSSISLNIENQSPSHAKNKMHVVFSSANSLQEKNMTNRRSAYSLKESVENSICNNNGEVAVSGGQPKSTDAVSSQTPIAGSALSNKKDSGYTSSRNSLEPSECGDEPSHRPEYLNQSDTPLLRGNRVSLISQQLEEQIEGENSRSIDSRKIVKPTIVSVTGDDSISISSTVSSLSAYSESLSDTSSGHQPNRVNFYLKAGHDSGTGDSEADIEDVTPTLSQQDLVSLSNTGANFEGRPIPTWNIPEVCAWLDSLYLGEYKPQFARAGVNGSSLMKFDRGNFISLGVTRVAHRISLENSLKLLKPSATTSF